MKLEKLTITASFPGPIQKGGEVTKKLVKAEGVSAWGLAIHRQVTRDSRLVSKDKWVVTHIDSGRRVLYGIPTKEEAIRYMTHLQQICPDWKFTEEELRAAENFEVLREYVMLAQGEINGNNKNRV